MADTKISDFAAQTTMLAADLMVTAQEDTSNKKITWENLRLASNVFPATAVPSADPNTLDDYEEGSWTPGLTFGGDSVDMTGTFTGTYIKIGNSVILDCSIVLTDKGSSVGTALITGQPISSGGFTAALSGTTIAFADYIVVNAAAGSIYLFQITNAGTRTGLNNTSFEDNSTLFFSTSYILD